MFNFNAIEGFAIIVPIALLATTMLGYWLGDKAVIRRYDRFYAWLEAMEKDPILESLRQLENSAEFYSVLESYAKRDGVANSKLYKRWTSKGGPNRLFLDLPFASKLACQ